MTPVLDATRSPVGTRLVNADQLAEVLGVSIDAVYRAVHQRGMPHLRFGRYYRFEVDEVLTWLRETAAV